MCLSDVWWPGDLEAANPSEPKLLVDQGYQARDLTNPSELVAWPWPASFNSLVAIANQSRQRKSKKEKQRNKNKKIKFKNN